MDRTYPVDKDRVMLTLFKDGGGWKMKALIAIIWVSSAVMWLISALIMIRAINLLKRVRAVSNQILVNDREMRESLLKLIPKSIARTVVIMNSKDEDAKAKLREMLSED
jgi:biopolymer transport protein ExbB/TolQ